MNSTKHIDLRLETDEAGDHRPEREPHQERHSNGGAAGPSAEPVAMLHRVHRERELQGLAADASAGPEPQQAHHGKAEPARFRGELGNWYLVPTYLFCFGYTLKSCQVRQHFTILLTRGKGTEVKVVSWSGKIFLSFKPKSILREI